MKLFEFNLAKLSSSAPKIITASVLIALAGCSSTEPQVTHHWVSQDKVASNTYRSDVAACSQGSATLDPASAEFSAYQSCMRERGYSLVAAADLDEVKNSQRTVNTRY